MFLRTRAFVFRTVKYGDHHLIADLFTLSHGLVSFSIPGARKAGKGSRAVFLQTLSLLELVMDFREGRNLQTLRDLKFDRLFPAITCDIRKAAILLFLSEVLRNSIREKEPNEDLFQFIEETLNFLDAAPSGYGHLSLHFLVHLTAHLGFFPSGRWSPRESSLNLREGTFTPYPESGDFHLEPEPSSLLDQILQLSREDLGKLPMNREQRLFLLERMLTYYRLHLDYFGELKSLRVLREIF